MGPTFATLSIDVATVGAGTAEDRYIPMPWPGEWKLVSAWLCPATTDALDATNYTTITLKQGSTSLGSLSNETVAFTAGTAREFTLTGGSALEFGEGDDLNVNKAESGTGGILDGCIALCFEKLHK